MTDMTDELELLAARSPQPSPTDIVVARHRAQLRDATTADRGSAKRARRAIAVVAVASACIAVIGVAAMTDAADGPSRLTTRPGAPATTAAATPLTCDAVPARVNVPSAVSDSVDGPAPGNGRPTADGQRVTHWATTDGHVEIRWPAAPRATYDVSEPRDPAGLATLVASAQRVELSIGRTDTAAAPAAALPPTPDVIVDTNGFTAPATASCAVLDITINVDGRSARTGVDLRSVDQLVDLRALVIARERMARPPTTVRPCQSPPGVDRPPTRTGYGPADAWEEATAADALARFLGTPDARGFAPSGYVEFEGDATHVTYAKPIDGGDGYVVLISIERVNAGWTVVEWKASGC